MKRLVFKSKSKMSIPVPKDHEFEKEKMEEVHDAISVLSAFVSKFKKDPNTFLHSKQEQSGIKG